MQLHFYYKDCHANACACDQCNELDQHIIRSSSRCQVKRRPFRSATDVTALDVFRRDHWTCQQCQRPVARGLYGKQQRGAPICTPIKPCEHGNEWQRSNLWTLCLGCFIRERKALQENDPDIAPRYQRAIERHHERKARRWSAW